MTVVEFVKALEGTDEVEITTIGRRSGRKIGHPVWFVQEGDRIYLLPVKGSDSDWYENVLKNPKIEFSAGGITRAVQATPITDAARVQDVVEKFRAKYGPDDVKKYYSKFDVAVDITLSTP